MSNKKQLRKLGSLFKGPDDEADVMSDKFVEINKGRRAISVNSNI